MQYDANGALMQTELPGIPLVNRGKVRDVYDRRCVAVCGDGPAERI